MYAIVEDGGKQYKVSVGDHLLVERRDMPEGSQAITFDKILMIGEGDASRFGTPYVAGASVSATLVEDLKAPKVVGVKFSRRKGYKLKFGHRQKLFRVSIDQIHA